jgi:uncharacterized membrane protein
LDVVDDEGDRREQGGRNWRPAVSLILCAIGLGISVYTLYVHYQPTALACVDAGPIDCQAVLTSAQSSIFGLVPVPYLGITFFLIIGALCLPVAWRSEDTRVHLARLVVSIVGIGMIFYLIITELFSVKKICLWCTGVHVVTFILFVIIVTSTPALLERTSRHRLESAA